MSWKTDITTPRGEPELLVMNGANGRTLLVLWANGLEASLCMDTDTMRELRDELTERLEKAAAKEAA